MIRFCERELNYGPFRGWSFKDITDRGYEDIEFIKGLYCYDFIKFKYGGKYHKIRVYNGRYGIYFYFGKTIYAKQEKE